MFTYNSVRHKLLTISNFVLCHSNTKPTVIKSFNTEIQTFKLNNMKKTMLVAAVSIFATVTSLTSCTSPKENVEEKREDAVEARKEYKYAEKEYLKDIENYRKSTDALILNNEAKIVDLRAETELKKNENKKEVQEKITELEAKNNELRLKMFNYQANGKNKWEKFKKEFSHDMDELGNSLKNFSINSTQTKK